MSSPSSAPPMKRTMKLVRSASQIVECQLHSLLSVVVPSVPAPSAPLLLDAGKAIMDNLMPFHVLLY